MRSWPTFAPTSPSPITHRQLQRRFAGEDANVLSGVLTDLTRTGLVYRSGRGDRTVYRIADPADFDDDARAEANEYLVWLTAYRQGPISARGLADQTGLAASEVDGALATLAADGRVEQVDPADGGSDSDTHYRSPRFDVAVGPHL